MRFQTTVAAGVVTALALGLSACGESIDSGDVDTSGVWADFWAEADGNGQTLMHAGLRTGGPNSNTFLTLKEGDSLTFYADGDSYTPNAESAFRNYEVYEKSVPKTEGGTNVEIEFTRSDKTNAPNSSATLPDRFEINQPSESDSFSRSSDDIQVTLSNTGSNPKNQTLNVPGAGCIKDGYESDFTGKTITIPHEELEDSGNEDADDNCEIEIEIERKRTGSVDSAYEGGEFETTQVRSIKVQSTP